MVFTLVVHLWTQPGKEAEMKDILIEASQTYLKDKGTINWFVMQDAQDPTAWSIVERYEDAGVSR
jgi:quinol monooxygenase YgiN